MKHIILAVAVAASLGALAGVRAEDAKTAKCIVAGREVKITPETRFVVVNGQKQYFCCGNCEKGFVADPESKIKNAGNCPVNTKDAANVVKSSRLVLNNGLYYFCCPGCDGMMKSTPEKFAKVLVDPVTKREFKPTSSSPRVTHAGALFLFEDTASCGKFQQNPAAYAVAYK